jgi:hypothetical protein
MLEKMFEENPAACPDVRNFTLPLADNVAKGSLRKQSKGKARAISEQNSNRSASPV